MPRQRRRSKNKQLSAGLLLLRSPTALALATRRSKIQPRLRAEAKKVWPVAQVARLFEISERLLWDWITEGFLSRNRRPIRNYQKGITTDAIRKFLKHLEESSYLGENLRRSRKRAAADRCKNMARQLQPEEQLTPRQFAMRARVSLSTVRRLVAGGILCGHRPTPSRIKLCHPSQKYGKKRLTAKKAKKRG